MNVRNDGLSAPGPKEAGNPGGVRGNPQDAKSIFVSYARDEDERFIDRLLRKLQEGGYEVVSCGCPENAWPAMIQTAMTCRNVALVSTAKYVYTCLMGQVESDRLYARYPSLVFPGLTGSLDRSLSELEPAMKVAFTIFGMATDKNMTTNRLRLLCDLLTRQVSNAGPVRYYFSDDYCLEESQFILRNESLFSRIVTLFRSGENCICRYPIIDCSQDSNIDDSFSELFLYLQSKPSQRSKSLQLPQVLPVVSRPAKGRKGPLSHDDVTFWRLSNHHLLAMIPSCYQGEFKGTANVILQDWEAV